MSNNDLEYDSFVRNPPNPFNDHDLLNLESPSLNSNYSPNFNAFNISSFNVNGLKMQGPTKMEQISSFFSLKNISFGGIVDTHLSPKQMKFLSKRISDYTCFSSDLDSSRNARSTGGVHF
jgi:hypothetical protein